MASDPPRHAPRFVPDSPLGGRVNLDGIIGKHAPAVEDESQEQVWPDIPAIFGLPPAYLDGAICEVSYLSDLLKKILVPTPLPGDDMAFCSDMLLSLETRGDITAKVLEYSEAVKFLSLIAPRRSSTKDCNIPDDEAQFNIQKRAGALVQHWTALQKAFRESMPLWEAAGAADAPFPPLVTEMAEGNKPAGWKLHLDDTHDAEARKLYDAIKARRVHALSYFRHKRPSPMGWVPAAGSNAWQETAREKVESGDLYHSKKWSPIYMSFDLQAMDVPFNWKDPDATEEELERRKEDSQFYNTWVSKSLDMRKERDEWKKNQGQSQ